MVEGKIVARPGTGNGSDDAKLALNAEKNTAALLVVPEVVKHSE